MRPTQSPVPDSPVRKTALHLSLGFITATALMFLAMILRSPLTDIAPVVDEIRHGLGIDSTTVGLMTSIPVLCFGVLTPFASALIAKTSVETAIFVTFVGALIGLILRSVGGIEISMLGTVLIGAALTIGNIVALVVIARDFATRKQLMTGLYCAFMGVGSMLATALTVPLAQIAGWRAGLATPLMFVVPGLVLWGIVARMRRTIVPQSAAKVSDATPATPIWQRPLVWLLIFAFTLHLMIYYCLTAWLPDYYITDTHMAPATAGVIAAMFQILTLLGAFGAPVLAKKVPGPWSLVIMSVCWLITPIGFWLAPHGYLVWSAIGGFATGGGFTVIFVLIMQHARTINESRTISAAVQGGGYTLSAAGPMLMGYIHQVTGSWSPAFLALTGAGAAMVLCALIVVRTQASARAS